MSCKKVLSLFALLLFSTVSTPALAFYPEDQDITLYVPESGDTLTVELGEIIKWPASDFTKKAFFPTYKPGGGGHEAYEALANSAPDGYSLALVSIADLCKFIADGTARYTLDDFHFIGTITFDPVVLAVSKRGSFARDSKKGSYTKISEAIQSVKRNRPLVTMCLSNRTATESVMFDYENDMMPEYDFAKMNTRYLMSMKELLERKYADFAFFDASKYPRNPDLIKELEPVCVFASERVPELPNTPTYSEVSRDVKIINRETTIALVAPAGIPLEVQDKLQELLQTVMHSQYFNDRMKETRYPVKEMYGDIAVRDYVNSVYDAIEGYVGRKDNY